MQLPSNSRTKALIIVDVQPSFLNERNEYVVQNILKLLSDFPYNLYIEATFHAEKDSLWNKQQQWTCPEGENTKTAAPLAEKLKILKAVQILKQTKSVFKGGKDLVPILREKGIEEIHVVGLDTNDCVLATAYEAFDLGFFTYVIEECCESSSSKEVHEEALNLLRAQNMTNNSCVKEIDFRTI